MGVEREDSSDRRGMARDATSDIAPKRREEEDGSAHLPKSDGAMEATPHRKERIDEPTEWTDDDRKEFNRLWEILRKESSKYRLTTDQFFSLMEISGKTFRNYIVERRNDSSVFNPEVDELEERIFVEKLVSYASKLASKVPHGAGIEEALKSFLSAHFARAHAEDRPPVPTRRYIPRQDEIIPFLREVWDDWLVGGHLQRQILHDHDPDAYSALSNWLRNNELPEDMDIPTNREVTDRELESEWFHRDDVPRIASAMARRARFPR